MHELSDDERNLLRYYAETERIIHGPARGTVHQHLLGMGYIEEGTVDTQRHAGCGDCGRSESVARHRITDRHASQLVAGEGVTSSV
jgi:hypothetical protein